LGAARRGLESGETGAAIAGRGRVQGDETRRRFLTLLGAAALTPLLRPETALAQPAGKIKTIGFLGTTTPTIWSANVAAFVQRLRELGWADGSNVAIEFRWAAGRDDHHAALATELVRRNVDVIVTAGTTAVIAVRRATSRIPIVFAAAGDPVRTGLVASLPHPGGNVTGLSNLQTDLGGRRLELLGEVVPGLKRVAILGNVDSPLIALEMAGVEAAALKLGIVATRFEVRTGEEIGPAFDAMKAVADALYVCSDPFLTTHRVRINTLAIGAKLPTMNAFREYVVAGGLMSYGPNFPDLFRRSGDFVDKILRGAKPADIPVEQPIKFDLVINNTTAKALGMTIPESFLLRANEVIE
jgi:putative tryptophan/tyrosine transport system substrate-binding protein